MLPRPLDGRRRGGLVPMPIAVIFILGVAGGLGAFAGVLASTIVRHVVRGVLLDAALGIVGFVCGFVLYASSRFYGPQDLQRFPNRWLQVGLAGTFLLPTLRHVVWRLLRRSSDESLGR
jgi:uncharacterized membrane protein YeaQ/YmgE (transglycosylase-associated protein family)